MPTNNAYSHPMRRLAVANYRSPTGESEVWGRALHRPSTAAGLEAGRPAPRGRLSPPTDHLLGKYAHFCTRDTIKNEK